MRFAALILIVGALAAVGSARSQREGALPRGHSEGVEIRLGPDSSVGAAEAPREREEDATYARVNRRRQKRGGTCGNGETVSDWHR